MARSHLFDFLQTCWFQLFEIPDLNQPVPFLAHHMANLPVAGFNHITFPGITVNTEKIREGTFPWEHSVIMNATVDPITLRSGMMDINMDFYTWTMMGATGVMPTRRTLALYQLDRSRYARKMWVLYGCIPSGFWGPDLDATSSEVGIEELTLEITHMTQVPLGPGFPLA